MNHSQKYELCKYAGGASEGVWAGMHPEHRTYGGVGANTGASVGLGGKPLEVAQVQNYRKLKQRSDNFPDLYSKVKSVLGPNSVKTKAMFRRGVGWKKDLKVKGQQLAPEFQGER